MNSYEFARARSYFQQQVDFTTGPHEVNNMLDRRDAVVMVDVRQPADYRKGHVPGALNLPHGTWTNPKGLAKDRPNILYCYSQTCRLAARAAVRLAAQGYPVLVMEGGFAAWEGSSYPLQVPRPQPA